MTLVYGIGRGLRSNLIPLIACASLQAVCCTICGLVTGGSDGGGAGGWGASRLYMHPELPQELAFNVHVRSGYRAGLSPGQCVCSILQWHNETGVLQLDACLPALTQHSGASSRTTSYCDLHDNFDGIDTGSGAPNVSLSTVQFAGAPY